MRNAFELFIVGRGAQKQPRKCSKKKSVVKNFAKSKGKHLGQNLFFNKVYKRDSSTGVVIYRATWRTPHTIPC